MVDLLDEFTDEGAEDEAGVGGAKAEVGSGSESDVGIGFAVESDFARAVEDFFVVIGTGPAEGDAAVGRDGVPMDIRFLGDDPAEMGDGTEVSEVFFGGERNAFGVFADEWEGAGIGGEVVEDAGDRVDDRVTAAGEGEIGESHHFLAIKGAVVVGGICECREKAVAGISFGAIELLGEIVFEGIARAVLGVFVAEDVHAPADVGIGFGLGDIEEVGERS